MSTTMKAAVQAGAQGLQIQTVDIPEPGPDEVLVKVRACGLNRADIGMAAGHAHGSQGGPGTRLGMENQPAFVLAARQPLGLGLRVVRMDLHRQLLAGEQIFDQQIGRRIAGSLKPDLADGVLISRRIGEARPQFVAAPRFFDTMGGEKRRSHSNPPVRMRNELCNAPMPSSDPVRQPDCGAFGLRHKEAAKRIV